MAVSTKQLEDQWAWVDMGSPFPDGPMRVKGEQNQYVALWYKHGKPLCGRAWNNGGKVECSFPYSKVELNTVRDLAGKIQILTFDNMKDDLENWTASGFYYQWVPWAAARTQPNAGIVRCGDAAPILMVGKDGNTYSGNIRSARIAYGGKVETKKGSETANLLTIVRNFVNPGGAPPQPLDLDDRWIDVKEGDDWSKVKNHIPVCTALKGRSGPQATPSVVLWYMQGQPVMGAMWSEGGKIQCAFGWGGREHLKNIGSIQVLVYNPNVAAFKISWQTYATAIKPGSGWRPVKVTHSGVDCAPCVIENGGRQFLGKVSVSQEKATYPDAGKEVEITGPAVQNFLVLCRDK